MAGHFQPAQIQLLANVFQRVDHDADGTVSDPDLRHALPSLGIAPAQPVRDALLAARPAHAAPHPADLGIDFPMFLTMMSERLCHFDPDAELIEAFESFDDGDTGLVKVDELRKWLADVGDRMDPHEIDAFLSGPFTDRHGNFNYREWIRVVRASDDARAET